ncbi:fimbrial protein [Providencia rettgeri]|uniref:fimbrial protein n=1 Tax=Providencia rettgeri TaxID=587 RepID=UPI0034E06D8E
MLNTQRNKFHLFLASLLLTSTMQSFAGNKLEIFADITSVGECEITVSPSNIEFTRKPAIAEFKPNDAVDLTPIEFEYQCRDYETTVMPEIKVTGSVSSDPNVFLTPDPTGAKGVGFMLKNGNLPNKLGFYTAGTTLRNNESFYLPAGSTSGSQPMTIGFVRQSGNNAVTAGSVKASILFTVVMP